MEDNKNNIEKKLVIGTSYCGRDCTTYGHCPVCNAIVYNGMAGTHDKCPECQTPLKW